MRWPVCRVGPQREGTGGSGQQRPDGRERWATGGAQAAGVPAFADARWPAMREDAAEACCCGQRAVLPWVARARLAAEGDVPVCTLCEAVGGERHATDGGGEVGDALVASPGGLTVGAPGLAPDVGGHGTEQVGVGAWLLARTPDELRQRAHRYPPVRSAGEEPARTLGRQGSAWSASMAMRRRGQRAAPGVPAAQHADLAAAVGGGAGERRHRGSGGVHEPGGPTLGVRAGDGAQCRGQGHGDATRGHGPPPLPLLVEPPGGGGVVARGTRAVRAGMVAGRACLARGALGDMTAERVRAAWGPGRHGGQGAGGPLGAAAGAGVGAMRPEDVGQRDQGSPRATRSGRAGVP